MIKTDIFYLSCTETYIQVFVGKKTTYEIETISSSIQIVS